MVRLPRLLASPGSRDIALGALLTVAAQVELFVADGVEGSRAWHAIAFAVITCAVGLRRRAPFTALAAGGVAMAVTSAVGEVPDVVTPLLALIILTYSVASYADTRRALAALGLVVVSILVYPLLEHTSVVAELGNVVIFGAIWVLGVLVRSRETRAVEAEAAFAAERAAAAAERTQAVRDERLRIARELHDVVAHGVSGMVLHAGAARQVLEAEPETAKSSLLEVERTGRQALAELRTLLTVMRLDDHVPGDLVDGALRRLRDAGLAVEERLEWRPAELEPAVAATVGRIVQEAATNVIRHADGAARVSVRVADDGDAVRVRVADDGRVASPVSPGLGLVGMVERAGERGGSVTAGPAPEGGWCVEAHVPKAAR